MSNIEAIFFTAKLRVISGKDIGIGIPKTLRETHALSRGDIVEVSLVRVHKASKLEKKGES